MNMDKLGELIKLKDEIADIAHRVCDVECIDTPCDNCPLNVPVDTHMDMQMSLCRVMLRIDDCFYENGGLL